MKKILISILYVLLIVLAYFAIFNGLSFANVKILSVEQIVQENDNLTNNIEGLKSLLKKDYTSKQEGLSTAVQRLLQKKEEYYDLANISTENEITKANTEETYLIEYLWTRIGRHATTEGVNLKMDVNTGEAGEANIKNLNFTANGQYIAIIHFISALEDDDKLNFKIENFKISGSSGNLKAEFTVRNIRIKSEATSSILNQSIGLNKSENTIGKVNEIENSDNSIDDILQ